MACKQSHLLPTSALCNGRSNSDRKSANIETKEDEQRKFVEVQEYLVKGEYPAGSTKSEKLVVRRRAKDYQIVDGQLHYVGHLKGSKLEEDPTKRVCSCTHAAHI